MTQPVFIKTFEMKKTLYFVIITLSRTENSLDVLTSKHLNDNHIVITGLLCVPLWQ